jgi:MoaA/NifB/PqqE/SkfB family radical SAM enzyme
VPAVGEAAPRLFRKKIAEDAPITAASAALFRFGEQCNYRCPMCSNTGEKSLFFRDTRELLRRANLLHGLGFRRVVVTGGEATIHPAFWTVVERLSTYGMAWDINTHGRSFAESGFAARAVGCGLQRAIVSLHSFDPPTSAAIFGVNVESHHGTVAGVERLLEAGVDVMLNCVISELNLDQIEGYVPAGLSRFGSAVSFKFVFPSTIGKGGGWSEIADLRYDRVRPQVRAIARQAREHGVRISFESIPACVLADPHAVNFGRSTFGESHYLDDVTGDRVYAMRHIEAELATYAEACLRCSALRRCSGVARSYARRWGVGELEPFAGAQGEVESPPAPSDY